jgi:hypothetical protein
MVINNNNEYIGKSRPADAIEEFAPEVRNILREIRKKRKLSAVARKLGFHHARLTEMITKNGDGDYKRKITPFYLAKFIDGGVMTVQQVLGNKRLEDLPLHERIFFERMIVSKNTLRLVVEAQRRGIDIDRLLETILYTKGKERT